MDLRRESDIEQLRRVALAQQVKIEARRNRLGSFVRKGEGREQWRSRRPAPYSIKTANVS